MLLTLSLDYLLIYEEPSARVIVIIFQMKWLVWNHELIQLKSLFQIYVFFAWGLFVILHWEYIKER